MHHPALFICIIISFALPLPFGYIRCLLYDMLNIRVRMHTYFTHMYGPLKMPIEMASAPRVVIGGGWRRKLKMVAGRSRGSNGSCGGGGSES